MMKKQPDNRLSIFEGREIAFIPSKTMLLEEGKVADRLCFIRKGCLRLFFNNEGKDITFQFFFEGDFVASFDSLYKKEYAEPVLSGKHRTIRSPVYKERRFLQEDGKQSFIENAI